MVNWCYAFAQMDHIFVFNFKKSSYDAQNDIRWQKLHDRYGHFVSKDNKKVETIGTRICEHAIIDCG